MTVITWDTLSREKRFDIVECRYKEKRTKVGHEYTLRKFQVRLNDNIIQVTEVPFRKIISARELTLAQLKYQVFQKLTQYNFNCVGGLQRIELGSG